MTKEDLQLAKVDLQLTKAQNKLESTRLKRDKLEIREKEKKSKKVDKFVKKYLEKRMTSKKILKPNKMTVKIEEYKAPSVLGDENRFFKGEYEKEKRSLFFS
jgi:hypothetical protein